MRKHYMKHMRTITIPALADTENSNPTVFTGFLDVLSEIVNFIVSGTWESGFQIFSTFVTLFNQDATLTK